MAGFDVFLRSLRDEFGEQQVGTKQEHGNCDVPKSYITDTGFMLGNWASRQRGNYKNNKLSEERKERLEALGFV